MSKSEALDLAVWFVEDWIGNRPDFADVAEFFQEEGIYSEEDMDTVYDYVMGELDNIEQRYADTEH